MIERVLIHQIKTIMKSLKLLSLIFLILLVSYEARSGYNSSIRQTGIWVAPESASAVVDPLKGDATATAAGKLLYTKYCVVCHGNAGKGDGIAAAGLQIPPADHSSVKVQSQTDGAIFWKITTGRGAMASYKITLTETQRWQLVNFIRTLAKVSK